MKYKLRKSNKKDMQVWEEAKERHDYMVAEAQRLLRLGEISQGERVYLVKKAKDKFERTVTGAKDIKQNKRRMITPVQWQKWGFAAPRMVRELEAKAYEESMKKRAMQKYGKDSISPNYYAFKTDAGEKDLVDLCAELFSELDTLEAVFLFNAFKYIKRAGEKDPTKCVEDLKKALKYLKMYKGA